MVKNIKDVLSDFNLVHNYKYDYSKVEYTNAHTKICIVCPIHGKFYQTPNNHKHGNGCPKCKGNKISKTKIKNGVNNMGKLIEKFNIVHNNKYDYSIFKYTGSRNKSEIICPIHGIFKQSPDNHKRGIGCPKCANQSVSDKLKYTQEDVIFDFKNVHGNKYDYSIVKYYNNHEKVCIICPVHGKFWQTPANHKSGKGCKKCGDLLGGSGWFIPKIAERNKNEFIGRPCIIYVIKCFNDYELFYKIGITTKTIETRFSGFKYDYSILYSIESNLYDAIILENDLHDIHQNYKYLPKLKFDGYTECFSEINLEDIKRRIYG